MSEEELDARVRSVVRAIDILMVLTQGPVSLGSVVDATDLTKATVHRLLNTLTHQELVLQDPETGRYFLGPGILKLINAAKEALGGLGLLARPVMLDLQRATRETIALHVRSGDSRICLEECPSTLPIRYTSGLGESAPVHSGSAGKVLLAFSPETTRRNIIDRLARTSPQTVDLDQLRAEIAVVRNQGWAESRGERVHGAVAVSAPILGLDGMVVAALSVLGPADRLGPVLEDVRGPVVQSAQRISKIIQSARMPDESST